MASPGLIPKILGKVQEARRPERFTQDFLETKLGFSGGSARAIIPLLKRLGFIASDGTPTRLYDQFRNPDTQGGAMSQAIRDGYHELFERNEYAHELTKDKLVGLVTEITGASKDDSTTKCTVSTFNALKEFADFEAQPEEETEEVTRAEQRAAPLSLPDEQPRRHAQQAPDDVNLAVSYTINLNLPETTNPEVFNAIFRALKENLLGRS
tara:strand:+ start:540 stop:1169 length:630 start_codon:yes stop_codon:yes gene_type:complete